MATTALPTLSEVRAFTGDYLINAASHWSDSAGRWTRRLRRLGARASCGRRALNGVVKRPRRQHDESARIEGGSTVPPMQLTAAALAARRAADDLRAAKAKLLSTVRAAEAAGFEVGEDFSLTIVESATATAVGRQGSADAQFRIQHEGRTSLHWSKQTRTRPPKSSELQMDCDHWTSAVMIELHPTAE